MTNFSQAGAPAATTLSPGVRLASTPDLLARIDARFPRFAGEAPMA